MTDEWLDKLYHPIGDETHNAFISRLLNEFKYMTSSEKTNAQSATTDSSAAWDETDGYF